MSEQRLIDANALKVFLEKVRKKLPKESRDFFTRDEMILNFQQYIHLQPTIDAAPMVRCGKWTNGYFQDLVCTACTHPSPCNKKTPYCPNCGAKMEKEDKP